ncbi:MAG: hypothetical protein AAFQ80_07975 [Cyanobacteria bacterium J06621_8]
MNFNFGENPNDKANSHKDCLYPGSPHAKTFFQYFTHHWDFIIAPSGTKNWQTITDYKLQPRVLWRMFQNPKQILGVRFGQYTKYGMVDLDHSSLLHFTKDSTAFDDLCAAFETIGLCRFVILFSSWSQGVHVYFPLPNEVNTFDLACALRMAVEGAGFKVKDGQLELFPNTKKYKENKNGSNFSYFNGHRLPLQPDSGSRLLDDDLAPCSEGLGDFMAQMTWAAQGQDMERLRAVLSISRDWYYQRKYRFIRTSSKTKVREWQEDTEFLINEGFTDYGQTNELLREIGKYGRVFLALEGSELCQYMVETVSSLPGYQQYCRHRHEIEQRCSHWAKLIEPFWWPLGSTPARHTSYPTVDEQDQPLKKNSLLNFQRAEDCLKRLKETLTYLTKQVITLPQKVGERLQLLRETSKKLFGKAFSEGTLKKDSYKIHWHPKYDQKDCDQPKEFFPVNSRAKNQEASSMTENPQKLIIRKPLQLNTSSAKQSMVKITPPNVVYPSSTEPNPSQSLLAQGFLQKDQTPPPMKGFCTLKFWKNFGLLLALDLQGIINTLLRKLSGVSDQVLGLELFGSSYLIEILKLTMCSDFQDYSLLKYQDLERYQVGQSLIYIGCSLSSYDVLYLQRKANGRLETGETVYLSDELHSTQLRDDKTNSLVYVEIRDNKFAVKPTDLLKEDLII